MTKFEKAVIALIEQRIIQFKLDELNMKKILLLKEGRYEQAAQVRDKATKIEEGSLSEEAFESMKEILLRDEEVPAPVEPIESFNKDQIEYAFHAGRDYYINGYSKNIADLFKDDRFLQLQKR